MIWFFRCFFFVSLSLISACRQKETEKKHTEKEEQVFWKNNKHAIGFKIGYGKGFKVITVAERWNNKDREFQYLLYKEGSDIPPGFEKAMKVKLPVKTLAVLSSLYVAYVEKLGLYDHLVAVSEFRHLSSERVKAVIANGKVDEVGSNGNVNIEKLLSRNPDLVITYGADVSSEAAHPKLLEAGLKVAVSIEHMENTPLGRAEWIKFMAAFFDKEKEADSLFNSIESDYLKVKAEALKAKTRPSAYVGIRYGDIWYMPGGNSYAANLLKDANAEYLWEDNKERGSQHLSFEEVYQKASEADCWINTGEWKTINDVLKADVRYGNFKAVKTGNVYNNNKRLNEFGCNDYWESGIVHPHLVLSDLIKIFHPELLPGYKLVYYKKLER
jgi:iron complex transport system substrate-binding protein